MTNQLLEALQSAACYPHPTDDIRLLETHISWVLLTGDFAYKIKKPVNFGFLDFSTLAKRKFYCEEELRLNSRFSADVYLAVVGLHGNSAQSAADGHGDDYHGVYVDSDARSASRSDVLDYAVKMRQFDQGALLESLAGNGELGIADMPSLARVLADFHREVAAPLEASDKESGTPDAIADAALGNFSSILPLVQDAQRLSLLKRLSAWTGEQLETLHAVFVQRRADGFVRECHGDLHLRNIACLAGEFTFFDCIEFSTQLRRIDIQSELAFLLMDMERKQLRAHANRLLNSYLEYSGDYQGLALLPFYKAYRAMVRAKVAALAIADAEDQADKDALWAEYDAYTALAAACSEPQKPRLLLMHGVSGSGKSTVAAALADELGGIRLRSDVERKRLFGLAPDARSEEEDKAALYGEDASARTLDRLLELAAALLDLQHTVLLDATFIARQWREPFFALAKDKGVPLAIIDCQASLPTLRERLQRRQARADDASEAGVEVMERQLESVEAFSAEELSAVLPFNTEAPAEATIRETARLVRNQH